MVYLDSLSTRSTGHHDSALVRTKAPADEGAAAVVWVAEVVLLLLGLCVAQGSTGRGTKGVFDLLASSHGPS
jgi:hypothetical protein